MCSVQTTQIASQSARRPAKNFVPGVSASAQRPLSLASKLAGSGFNSLAVSLVAWPHSMAAGVAHRPSFSRSISFLSRADAGAPTASNAKPGINEEEVVAEMVRNLGAGDIADVVAETSLQTQQTTWQMFTSGSPEFWVNITQAQEV